jgi:hypothetical protein
MGVSISYWTVQSPSREVVEAIKGEAERINGSRRWWMEPLMFFDWPEHAGKLAGDTKVYWHGRTLHGEYREFRHEDNCFMEARDVTFIIDQLARWSKEHAIDWEVTFFEPYGFIVNGEPDQGVKQLLADLNEPARIEPDMDSGQIEERAREIDQLYSWRFD